MRRKGPQGIGPYRTAADVPPTPEPTPVASPAATPSVPVGTFPAPAVMLQPIAFEGPLTATVRADLYPPIRKSLIAAGLLKAMPTFLFFAVAFAFRSPYADRLELIAVSIIAVAGTGYFIAREFEAASSWWSQLIARFPAGVVGSLDADRLVVPALDLSVQWRAVRAIVTAPDGLILDTPAGPLALHASMFAQRSDWVMVCSCLAAALEHNAG